MNYEWNEDDRGTNHSIEVGNDGSGPWLLAGHDYVDWGAKSLLVNLPTDPIEVAKLVAAILNASDCRLERLVFPEDALKGMHGMTVVKR